MTVIITEGPKQITFLGPEYLEFIYIAIREKAEEQGYLIKSEFQRIHTTL